MISHGDNIDRSSTCNEEKIAQDLVEHGEIDQAIDLYRQLQPESARIFRAIGLLYADNKGCYDLAISCYEQALRLQEENGEDTSEMLTKLGSAYQHLREFDIALAYHFRALSVQQTRTDVNRRFMGNSLFGIANAYWGQKNLSEALIYAQRSLAFTKSLKCSDDSDIAANLAVLANIYHDCGDDIRALELVKESLILLERCTSSESVLLVAVLNNMATIQLSAGLFDDALLTFIRVMQICERTVPEGHPKRVAITNNVQCVIAMQQQNDMYSFSHLWQSLSKILLF